MGILALQDADCVTNSCPASAYIPLTCSFGNYTFIGMVINPKMKRFNETLPYCYEIEVVPIGKQGLSVTHQLHVIIRVRTLRYMCTLVF